MKKKRKAINIAACLTEARAAVAQTSNSQGPTSQNRQQNKLLGLALGSQQWSRLEILGCSSWICNGFVHLMAGSQQEGSLAEGTMGTGLLLYDCEKTLSRHCVDNRHVQPWQECQVLAHAWLAWHCASCAAQNKAKAAWHSCMACTDAWWQFLCEGFKRTSWIYTPAGWQSKGLCTASQSEDLLVCQCLKRHKLISGQVRLCNSNMLNN